MKTSQKPLRLCTLAVYISFQLQAIQQPDANHPLTQLQNQDNPPNLCVSVEVGEVKYAYAALHEKDSANYFNGQAKKLSVSLYKMF